MNTNHKKSIVKCVNVVFNLTSDREICPDSFNFWCVKAYLWIYQTEKFGRILFGDNGNWVTAADLSHHDTVHPCESSIVLCKSLDYDWLTQKFKQSTGNSKSQMKYDWYTIKK